MWKRRFILLYIFLIFLTIFTKYLLNSFAISVSSSIISLLLTNLIFVLALTFVIWHRIYIKICKMFFSGFFKRFTQNFRCFLSSFRDIFVLSLKIFALRHFCVIGVFLFKRFKKILRKYLYSILFISCFNISLSNSALNSSLRNFPVVYYFWF